MQKLYVLIGWVYKLKYKGLQTWCYIIGKHTHSHSPTHLCVEHVQYGIAQVINGLHQFIKQH